MMKSVVYKPDTFLYFAYAANLLKFRIRMFNPTAEFVSIARLDNYRLDFINYAKFWGGPLATVVPTANAHVWGVIWRLNKEDMKSLDRFAVVFAMTKLLTKKPNTTLESPDDINWSNQHDIDRKYFIKYVEVLTPHMGTFRCRAYLQKVYPLPRGNRDPIPVERWPSWSYKEIIIMGAKENGLPQYYIRLLKKYKDNGDEGYIRTDCLLMRYGKNLPCDCRLPRIILREPLKLDLKRLRKEGLMSDIV